jgi:tetratricopeptide (TPR) repeat protein
MYNLGISLLLLIVVTALLMVVAGLPFWIASLVGMIAFTICYILIMRFVLKKVGTLMEISQRDLQAGRTEKAVKTLESGFKYRQWQFYVGPQINSQIGTIYYLKREFGTAFDYLVKGFVRHWIAMGMLGICYMKRNKSSKMIDTFEKATAASKKEPLVWNLYAYCLEHIGDRDKAIAVMKRGLKKTGGDERLQANLEALEEGRKMKMRSYGDMWLQFHLEKPGTLVRQQTKAIQGRRKIARR